MDRHHMLENIKAHSIVVAKISRVLAKALRDMGADISLPKTTAGALLHDIGKTSALKTGRDHAEIGRIICMEHNLGEIADLVGEHIRLRDYERNGHYSEKEIVYYADKRVNHDRIVPLEERLSYILNRYGRNLEDLHTRIRENFALCTKVEQKLFRELNFSPVQLAELAVKEKISPR